MPEDLSSIDVSHLDALVKLEADHRAIQALSEKAARRRDKELEVYSRVMRDYAARMNSLLDQASVVRQRVRDDVHKLDALYNRYADALDQARVQLQECEFRHEIGEFTHEEFQQSQQEAEQAISEREAEFEGIKKLRLRYLEMLPGEQMTPAPAPPAPEAVTPVPAAPPPAPVVTPPAPVAATPARAVAPPARAAASAVAAPVPPAPAPPQPPDPPEHEAAPVSAESPVPDAGNTIFLRPPSPTDFKVPPRGKAAGDTEAFGTIAISAAMLIEDRSGLPGPHHRLGAVTTIGRTPDNQIVVPIKEVSRRHAQIVMVSGGFLVKDLGSPNGTFVNGERIKEHHLKEGDKVTFGGKVFIFKAP